MSKPIEKFLRKISVQTAVYWKKGNPDGYGGFTYDTPREIPVRWSDTTKVVSTDKDTQYVCKAEVIVNEDVDKEGYLYLGKLSDLTAEQQSDPRKVDGAHKIIRFDKVPMIMKNDEFVRKAYL